MSLTSLQIRYILDAAAVLPFVPFLYLRQRRNSPVGKRLRPLGARFN
ncbi:MAG: hypothetical protein H0U87_01550 [Acidobacteria bacterium]|nr:hypothetical protein [Acidobacteriota bacterium]